MLHLIKNQDHDQIVIITWLTCCTEFGLYAKLLTENKHINQTRQLISIHMSITEYVSHLQICRANYYHIEEVHLD